MRKSLNFQLKPEDLTMPVTEAQKEFMTKLANASPMNPFAVSGSEEGSRKQKDAMLNALISRMLRDPRLPRASKSSPEVAKRLENVEEMLKRGEYENANGALGLILESLPEPAAAVPAKRELQGHALGEKYQTEQYRLDDTGNVLPDPNWRSQDDRIEHLRTGYYTDQERDASAFEVDDQGRLYSGGRPVNTADLGTEVGYVVSKEEGTMHYFDSTKRDYPGNGFEVRTHHSSPIQGGEAAAAGTIKIDEGVITEITDLSGHYTPTPEMTHQLVEGLIEEGVQVHDANVKVFDPTVLVTPKEWENVQGRENEIRDLVAKRTGLNKRIVDLECPVDNLQSVNDWVKLCDRVGRFARTEGGKKVETNKVEMKAWQFAQTGGNIAGVKAKRELNKEINARRQEDNELPGTNDQAATGSKSPEQPSAINNQSKPAASPYLNVESPKGSAKEASADLAPEIVGKNGYIVVEDVGDEEATSDQSGQLGSAGNAVASDPSPYKNQIGSEAEAPADLAPEIVGKNGYIVVEDVGDEEAASDQSGQLDSAGNAVASDPSPYKNQTGSEAEAPADLAPEIVSRKGYIVVEEVGDEEAVSDQTEQLESAGKAAAPSYWKFDQPGFSEKESPVDPESEQVGPDGYVRPENVGDEEATSDQSGQLDSAGNAVAPDHSPYKNQTGSETEVPVDPASATKDTTTNPRSEPGVASEAPQNPNVRKLRIGKSAPSQGRPDQKAPPAAKRTVGSRAESARRQHTEAAITAQAGIADQTLGEAINALSHDDRNLLLALVGGDAGADRSNSMVNRILADLKKQMEEGLGRQGRFQAVIENQGGGDCFYYSILDSGEVRKVSNMLTLRGLIADWAAARKSQWEEFALVDPDQIIHEIRTKGRFADNLHQEIAAMACNLRFDVYGVDPTQPGQARSSHVGSGTKLVNLLHSGNHFEYLLPLGEDPSRFTNRCRAL
jgi:hypothetical protein